ncbi:uncharacterized protein LOC111266784 isoform X1 [Varroa jacobsoni]|uniref:uncharacterized protein LOC111266784 isoform X1 n=1 Tax=Varroa jacobsoni TaxID=62625 RepID=UPI000BF5AD4D|nr:uncharacterized protein LOC111266784 isoform X1 [Varroa jacobsoni]
MSVATYSKPTVTEQEFASIGVAPNMGLTSDAEDDVLHEHLQKKNYPRWGATQEELNKISFASRRMMIAGGFLDIALFTTNCEQLKFAIESEYLITDTRFKFVIVMLAVSLTLQAVMALLFFMMGFFDNGRYSQRRQRFINNVIMLLVALVTLVNIVISTFSNKGEIANLLMKIKDEIRVHNDGMVENVTKKYLAYNLFHS